MRQNGPEMPQDGSRMGPDASKLSVSFRMGGVPEAEGLEGFIRPLRAFKAFKGLIRLLRDL